MSQWKRGVVTPRVKTSYLDYGPGGDPPGGDLPLNVGQTAHFQFFVTDDVAKARLDPLVVEVADSIEDDYRWLNSIFGTELPGPQAKINLDETRMGGTHINCDGTNFWIEANLEDRLRTRFAIVAEVTEVLAFRLSSLWDCGNGLGEGLSRALARDRYPSTPAYSVTQAWLNSDRRDFLTAPLPDDKTKESYACNELFLLYLHNEVGLRYPWSDIVHNPGPTAVEVVRPLVGNDSGVPDFLRLMDDRFPRGTAVSLPQENPFPIAPLHHLQPSIKQVALHTIVPGRHSQITWRVTAADFDTNNSLPPEGLVVVADGKVVGDGTIDYQQDVQIIGRPPDVNTVQTPASFVVGAPDYSYVPVGF
jgi:hypothetical protein